MTDAFYDLASVTFRPSDNPYVRFFDLLPIRDLSLLPGDATFTPTVHAKEVGAELTMSNLYLKDETGLPTGTTKDRMAAVALPFLYECGVRRFTTSSTGNSSSACNVRALARVPDMDMFVFTAENFRDRLTLTETERVVDVVLRDATFVDAFEASREFAQSHDISAERGFFNLGRREGLKVAWLEAVEQVPLHIDWYVQAVSTRWVSTEWTRRPKSCNSSGWPVRRHDCSASNLRAHGGGLAGRQRRHPPRARRRASTRHRHGDPEGRPHSDLPPRSSDGS